MSDAQPRDGSTEQQIGTSIAKGFTGEEALLDALHAHDEVEIERLLRSDKAAEYLAARNRRGCSPLMLAAMGSCSEEMARKIVARLKELGSVGAAVKSAKGSTAADYAEMHQASPGFVAELRAIEKEERAAAGSARCGVCGVLVPARSKLVVMVERSLRGEEDTPRLREFLSSETGIVRQLLRPAFHTLSDDKNLRKKLASSLAVLEALYGLVGNLDEWHIVDLCCGKSLTAALIGTKFPRAVVTAVDRRPGVKLPHYAETGFDVQYNCIDVLGGDFVTRLAAIVAAKARPTAILGIHLCGLLSEQAIEAFQSIPEATLCVLMPCCLPSLEKAPEALKHLYRTGEVLRQHGERNESFDPLDDEQYEAWGKHLAAKLQVGDQNQVRSFHGTDTLTKKCNIITATKQAAP